ncbi:transmembrane protein, putative [Bodo saltans]|uniref:Transmembrane protein, putative n=1 Tax=Bodo saltans TaxID=75058 RepID=A0A0S4JS55_BODSA|nr:transmembrane protein, putative [Bodo saltans]|eukprot:CUG93418.1 transmembrane protein, putative [Bodo saltans]
MDARMKRAIEVAQKHIDEQKQKQAATASQDQPPLTAAAIARNARSAEQVALDAMNEHNHPQLEMTDDLDKHEDRLGSGILYYFSFVRFLFLLALVFAVFQCVTFGDYIRRYSPDFSINGQFTSTGETIWLDNFMISDYPPDGHDERLWKAMNIICIILTFFSAPLYFYYLRRGENTSKYVDEDGEDIIIRFTPEGKIDVSNLYRGKVEVILRRVLSTVVILALIGVQVVASYFVTQNAVTNIGISFAISFIVAILNTAFMFIAERLTEFECWTSFERWKRYHTLKLLFFRLANVITVFAAKSYSSSENLKCAYDIIGQQLVTLLVTDIFAVNLQIVVVAMLWNKNANFIATLTKSIFGDQDNLPKFDIAVEYLQIVYRQYLVIMTMVVMPFSIFLSIVGFAIDYGTKKFILTKLCGVPRKVETSQKSLLTFVLFVIALFGLLTPYAGSMFMLSGLTRDKSDLCHFPG